MSKTTKRAIWAAWFLLMCWVMYQLFGWLGLLSLVAAGALGGAASVLINRQVKRDEQIAPLRNQPDGFNQ
jgi:putative flippase GtrA